jgi:hypothetical protein
VIKLIFEHFPVKLYCPSNNNALGLCPPQEERKSIEK